MTTEEKIKDIISTMVEYGLLDPTRALVDKDYLIQSVADYIVAANMAREILKMPKLEL